MRVSAAYFPTHDRYPYATNADDACYTVVHEWGHMLLGPTYFAATNPSDPAHSADPNSVMYATRSNVVVPACVAEIRRVRVGHTHRDRAYVAGVLVAQG